MALRKVLIEDQNRALLIDVYRVMEINIDKNELFIELRLRNSEGEEHIEEFEYETLEELTNQYENIKEQLEINKITLSF